MLIAPNTGLMFPLFLHLAVEFIEFPIGPYLLCLNRDHEAKLYMLTLRATRGASAGWVRASSLWTP